LNARPADFGDVTSRSAQLLARVEKSQIVKLVMWKIILIVTLVLMAMPLFERAKDYVSAKTNSAKSFAKKVEREAKEAVK
jgi:hypothetical protein